MLSPLLRAPAQGRLLAELLLHPERESTLTELARRTGDPIGTVLREVDRLSASELVLDRKVGQARLVQANIDHPLAAPLTQIMMTTYGAVPALREALTKVPGVQAAYVFGSWAARASGEPGPFPKDVDVLVVGEPDRLSVFDAAAAAERLIGRPVNPTVVSVERWANGEDGFVQTVRNGPLVPIDLEEGS